MKLVVYKEGTDWEEVVRVGCRADHHRHFATQVGTTVRLNCDLNGVIETWSPVPTGRGSVVVEMEVPATATCRNCGKKIESGGSGTVHVSSGKRGCF